MLASNTRILPPWQVTNHVTGLGTYPCRTHWQGACTSCICEQSIRRRCDPLCVGSDWRSYTTSPSFFQGYLRMHCAFAKAFCGYIAQNPHATRASHLVRERCGTHGLNITPLTFTLKEQQLSLWTNICLLQAKCSGEKTKQTNRKQFC